MVMKGGKKVSEEKIKKVAFKYNKKGKLTEKEEKKIKKTSKNICNWFSKGESLEQEGRQDDHSSMEVEVEENEVNITRSNTLSNVLLIIIKLFI